MTPNSSNPTGDPVFIWLAGEMVDIVFCVEIQKNLDYRFRIHIETLSSALNINSIFGLALLHGSLLE